jgi:hypothetical protein
MKFLRFNNFIINLRSVQQIELKNFKLIFYYHGQSRPFFCKFQTLAEAKAAYTAVKSKLSSIQLTGAFNGIPVILHQPDMLIDLTPPPQN